VRAEFQGSRFKFEAGWDRAGNWGLGTLEDPPPDVVGYPTSVADLVTRRDFFACFKLESENFKLPPPPDVVGYFGGTGNILLAIPISGPCYGGLA
jgi:hypothetical protein